MERYLWMDAISLMFADQKDGHSRLSIERVEKLQHLPASVRFLPEVTAEQRRAFAGLELRETTEAMHEFFKLSAEAVRMTPWEFYSTPNRVRPALEGILEKNAFIAWLGESPNRSRDCLQG